LFAGKSTHNTQVIRGILATGNSADNTLSNNMISLDLTQAVSPAAGNVLEGAASVYGIDFSNANQAFVNKLYYNTVRLAGSGAGNFGSAALYINVNQPQLTMNNNILVNEMTPSGSGHCNAMRVNQATYSSIQTTSNNNLFYTTQTANTALLRCSTSVNMITLADLKANVDPRETNSVDALPVFVDVDNNDLHLDGDDNCMIAGLGAPIAGITIDFDNDARDAVQPDIGADEFINNGGAPYTWAGVNTDWEDAVNWCSGVPQADHDVIIPSGLTNYPILTTNTNVVGSITIESGATVTLNAGAVLTVHGEDFEISGTLVNNGMLSFAGSVAQTFGTGSGNITAMNDIEFNNAAGLTIARDLDIYGELRPTDGNFILDNVDVTLRSTPTGSAFVSEVQSGAGFVYAGTGKFIVENYMATSGNEGWRFLSIPTNTVQTVNGAWMEGQTPGSYTATGYGTQIVGPSSAGAGFDANTYTTGMKTFDPSTNTWISIPGTGGAINNDNGYMIFVRGDRGSNTYGNSSNTILRTQGPIKTGQLTVTHPNATEFVSVGNPYPSAINFGLVSRTNVANRFYIWDPKLGTYGAYQTFNYVGGVYIPTPGGGSYASNANIESGQAFLIETTAANAQLVIEENDKAYGSNPVTRPLNTYALIRTNLYTVADGAPHLMDGVLNMYDAEFSNDLNSDDATKAGNFNESFGILNSDKILSVELREAVAVTDTIQYSMGAMKLNTPYRLTVTVQNLLVPDNTQAWLEDRFAGTLTPLGFDNDTDYDFTVSNAAGSYAADRFRIVFQRAAAPVPVRFTRIEATPNGKDVLVKWEVSNEVNIETYTVQRSTDGRNFSDVGEVNATGISGYHHTDVEPGTGVFYYRVRSNGIQAGDVLYSSIVSVVLAEQGGFITVYPNPVQDDRVVKIDIQGMEAGKFEARLLSTDGREVLKKVLYHPGGNAVHELRLSARMPRGIYTLMIKNSNTKTAVKIVY
jgi:hypothetical protein